MQFVDTTTHTKPLLTSNFFADNYLIFQHVSGSAYARHGRRRKSHEFEDLHLNTGATGTLFHIPEHAHRNDEDDGHEMRRRVYSMSAAHRILPKKRVQGSSSSSNASTPRHSPNTKRKHQLHKKGGNSNSSPRESIHESTEKITSLSDLHWVGDPEAIHSIRRARLTVDEQELETELHKLSVSWWFTKCWIWIEIENTLKLIQLNISLVQLASSITIIGYWLDMEIYVRVLVRRYIVFFFSCCQLYRCYHTIVSYSKLW